MTTAGSVEETWFDTFSVIDSDEEDFKSIPDGRLHISNRHRIRDVPLQKIIFKLIY